MMSIEEKSIGKDIEIVRKCKICEGKGKTQIFRCDLEEFEETECNYCK